VFCLIREKKKKYLFINKIETESTQWERMVFCERGNKLLCMISTCIANQQMDIYKYAGDQRLVLAPSVIIDAD